MGISTAVVPPHPARSGPAFPPRTRVAAKVGVAVATLSRRLGRGGGSVIGGRAILAIDPGALRHLAGDRAVALVSGTNGKTTTTSLLGAAMATAGPICTNVLGANQPPGLAAALAGGPPGGVAVLEVDEAWMERVVAATSPDVVVLLNLSRDQLDRNNEVRHLAARWRRCFEGGEGRLVVANADDPLVAWAAMAAPRVCWVGAGQPWTEDAAGCPSCGAQIVFHSPPPPAGAAVPGPAGASPAPATATQPAGSATEPPDPAGAPPAPATDPPASVAPPVGGPRPAGASPAPAAAAAPPDPTGASPAPATEPPSPVGPPPAPARAAGLAGPPAPWHCSGCDLRRPDLDLALEGDEVVTAEGRRHRLALALPGRANRANAAMALAAARHLGVDPAAALDAMAGADEIVGRYSTVDLGDVRARLLLAKNPAGWLEVLDVLRPGDAPVVVAINARIADGRDPSWLWDVPFERLAGRLVIASGERGRDLAVRLHYAEVEHRLVLDPVEAVRAAGEAALQSPRPHARPGPIEIDVVGNYTSFQTLRTRLAP